MSKQDSNENSIDYRKIPLQRGERSRIIIVEHDNGAITTLTKASKERIELSQVIGLIELAKAEAIFSMRMKKEEAVSQESIQKLMSEQVEITLDELDEEMDTEGVLKNAGYKIGVPFMVTKYEAMLRESKRDVYRKHIEKKD